MLRFMQIFRNNYGNGFTYIGNFTFSKKSFILNNIADLVFSQNIFCGYYGFYSV